ncbi:hypothetical protein ACFV0L_10155 [Streptosporangium canum]|uniref:hypothetical protein n=1 Tax=Streptosporangium canum TaxID=324952 RepID=UPI0036883823
MNVPAGSADPAGSLHVRPLELWVVIEPLIGCGHDKYRRLVRELQIRPLIARRGTNTANIRGHFSRTKHERPIQRPVKRPGVA